MKFDNTTNRADVTIQGKVFKVPAPFADGYVVNANEAGALNQLLIENTRNNFAGKVAAAVESKAVELGFVTRDEKGALSAELTAEQKAQAAAALDTTELQADLEKYVAEYEFGVRRGGGQILDPIEREAHDIAESLIKDALKKKGVNLKDFPRDDLKRLISETLADEAKGAAIRKKAAQIVKVRQSAASEELAISL